MEQERCQKCGVNVQPPYIRIDDKPMCRSCSNGAYTSAYSPYNNFKPRKTRG
jgi:formylmethanofuran dehydrogenase subunit E